MQRTLNTEKNRVIRKVILELLKQEYPQPVDFLVLWAALDNLGYHMDRKTLSAHICYLEEKEFVKTEKRKAYSQEIELVALTSKGWDLLDGIITNGGV
jgi:DNA-binding MarR family transcriptional regulator